MDRWRPLAEHKLGEVRALVARAQQMQRILESLLNCGCLHLEDCGISIPQRKALPDEA
jgi:hypothetical protein